MRSCPSRSRGLRDGHEAIKKKAVNLAIAVQSNATMYWRLKESVQAMSAPGSAKIWQSHDYRFPTKTIKKEGTGQLGVVPRVQLRGQLVALGRCLRADRPGL